jgi:hypothetical protein
MKTNKTSLFWGILLIGFGGYALAQSMGYEIPQEPTVWAYIFGGISLLSLVFYFVDGVKAWGWLFPVGIFGGLGIMMTLVANNEDNAAIASPLFIGLLIPFAVAYFMDRKSNWWALIPGGVMLFLALVTLLVDSTPNDEWIGALFLFLIALGFFVAYLNNRATHWWALIPAGVTFVLALIVILSSTVQGEWIGSLFLFAVGLSFVVVYLNNRTRQWALLVAYILFVLSIAPAMASFSGDTAAYFGSVFLLAIAVPFFVVYFRSEQQNWWAIIPAGVMTTLAVITTLAIAGWIRDAESGGQSNAILMSGLAITFAVIWLRHAKPWAKIVTIVLAALAVVSVFFVSYSEIIWPVAIILLGGYLLYTAMKPKLI